MRKLILICAFFSCVACTAPKKPDLLSLNTAASVAYESGDYKVAEEIYVEMLQYSQDNPDLYFRLGNCLAQQNKVNEAIESYQTAITLNPNLFKAWYNMGNLQLSQASNSFTQLLQLMPPSNPIYGQVLLIVEQLLEEEESLSSDK